MNHSYILNHNLVSSSLKPRGSLYKDDIAYIYQYKDVGNSYPGYYILLLYITIVKATETGPGVRQPGHNDFFFKEIQKYTTIADIRLICR